MDDIQATIKRYQMQGNREAAKVEQSKMKKLRKQHGIYGSISMFNMFQLPMHMVWVSLINRMAYNYDTNPAILSEGFFWFTDLSSPDPYGILPFFGGVISLLNILSASTNNINPTMRKLRRYLYVMPLISIPIWMTFPAAFNLYWMISSGVQLAIMNGMRNLTIRKWCGVPQYLPGTKLERLNRKSSLTDISNQ
jgi:YidC/Oxa1 family membrane protein insertase